MASNSLAECPFGTFGINRPDDEKCEFISGKCISLKGILIYNAFRRPT